LSKLILAFILQLIFFTFDLLILVTDQLLQVVVVLVFILVGLGIADVLGGSSAPPIPSPWTRGLGRARD
jgi:hypothetical protein